MTLYLTGAPVSSSLLKGLASVCETTRAPSMVMRAAVAAAFVVVLAVCETIVAAALAMHPASNELRIQSAKPRMTMRSNLLPLLMDPPRLPLTTLAAVDISLV